MARITENYFPAVFSSTVLIEEYSEHDNLESLIEGPNVHTIITLHKFFK